MTNSDSFRVGPKGSQSVSLTVGVPSDSKNIARAAYKISLAQTHEFLILESKVGTKKIEDDGIVRLVGSVINISEDAKTIPAGSLAIYLWINTPKNRQTINNINI